jgi:hypothetical protein
MNYDIIGDIHGECDKLIALLGKLGYRERQGAWRHPERTAVFVGDFIDRGPRQLDTVRTARAMVEAGSALAVMGNHEFNAIAWHLPDPDRPGDFLRSHFSPGKGAKNRRQHAAFLAEVEDKPQLHQEIIDWFLTLPLWLDLPGVRVVHACWHQSFMDFLAPALLPGNRVSPEWMVAASREPVEHERDTPEPTTFKAAEAVTKGVEIPLPAGHIFTDKDGVSRNRVRVRWWNAAAVNYRQAAIFGDLDQDKLPEHPIPEHARIGYAGEKPVVFGHYWFWLRPAQEPQPLSDKAACVDYSAVKGGPLVAYRWEGEAALRPSGFVRT